MSEQETDILAELILYARDNLLEARRTKDRDTLIRLDRVFDWLEDVCVQKRYVPLARVFSNISLSANDSLIGVDFKSHIPSDTEIFTALSETRKLTREET